MQESEAVKAVNRMQQWIEAHLDQPITLRQLADAAGYSPWHAARMFKERTGRTPFAYIRLRRLSKAALRLRDEQPRVVDVALDFVFDSHEGFTKAFSKQFGLTPWRYKNEAPPIPLFLPYPVQDPTKEESAMTKENGKTTIPIFIQVVDRPARKFLLLRGKKASEYFAYCEEVGCDIWGVLCSVKEALYEPVGAWLPPAFRTMGTSEYVQGVEVPLEYSNVIPEGLELIDLPPCKLMIFQGPPYQEEEYGDAINQVSNALDSFDPGIYGYRFAPEVNPRIQLAPMGYRGYIEGRPVESLAP